MVPFTAVQYLTYSFASSSRIVLLLHGRIEWYSNEICTVVFGKVCTKVYKGEGVDRPVDPKNIDIVILSRVRPQYDEGVRMLESSSDWHTREWIERAVINENERLECEKSAAGSRAMLSTRGHRRNDKPHPLPLLLPHRTLCLAMPRIPDRPQREKADRMSEGWRTWRQRRRRRKWRRQQK